MRWDRARLRQQQTPRRRTDVGPVGSDAETVARIRGDEDVPCDFCGYTGCDELPCRGSASQWERDRCARAEPDPLPGFQVRTAFLEHIRRNLDEAVSMPRPEHAEPDEPGAPWVRKNPGSATRYHPAGARIEERGAHWAAWRPSYEYLGQHEERGVHWAAWRPSYEYLGQHFATWQEAAAAALADVPVAEPDEPGAPWVHEGDGWWDHPTCAAITLDDDGQWDWKPPRGSFCTCRRARSERKPSWQEAAAAALADVPDERQCPDC